MTSSCLHQFDSDDLCLLCEDQSSIFSRTLTSIEQFQRFVAEKTMRELTTAEAQQMSLMGLSGEVGELTEIMKKVYFYKKPLDRDHMIEELGDILHYFFMFLNTSNVTLDEVIESNTKKISARYHTNVSRAEAIARADKIGKEDDVK